MNRKTLELLLVNYTNINNGLRTPCADKSKFEKLIKDVELKIKELPRDQCDNIFFIVLFSIGVSS